MTAARDGRAVHLAVTIGLLLAIGSSAVADTLYGRVTAVHDGDTITVLVGERDRLVGDDDGDKEPVRVRLSGIDTPERGQPWASRARQALSERVFGKEVRVIEVTVDAYGRTIGEVYADGVCVGCELVREGHAWVYRRYTDDPVLLELEAEAREKRAGLWALPESQRVPPWEWRHRSRGGRRGGSKAPDAKPPEPDLTCGAKRYCGEMASCAEARFHLERCGLDRLDGDGDGIPCEVLCR